MYIDKEITKETITKILDADPLHIVLVQAEDDSLMKNLCADYYDIYEIHYKHHKDDDGTLYVRNRMDAIQQLFKNWNNCGYNKHNAKNPFRCKSFLEYLEKIDYNNADYLIIREKLSQEWINTVISILGCASTNKNLSINKFVDEMRKSKISKKEWDNCEDEFMKKRILKKLNEKKIPLDTVLSSFDQEV